MNFAFSEEQEELRRIVRQFLDDKSDEQAVRALMATEKGFDDAVCAAMMKRARFDPALDKDAKPIKSYWRTSVRFQMP